MGDDTKALARYRIFPGTCAPIGDEAGVQWSCKIVSDGPVALVEADPTKTIVLTGTGATVVPGCLSYDLARQQVRWSGLSQCYEALSPVIARARAADRQAAGEMTTIVDVLRLGRTTNAAQLLRTQFPTAFEILIQVAESPEVDVHPMIIAALLNIEGKWLYRHTNRLGPGQVEPNTRRVIVASEEFQQAWRRMHHNLSVPIPDAEQSVLADLLVVGIFCARMRKPFRKEPGLPVPTFAAPVTATAMKKFIRQAQAMRVRYGYPTQYALARNVLQWGHTAVAEASGVRAGFVDRLHAFGQITRRLAQDYQEAISLGFN